jgi:hypothetical protein
VTRQLRSGPGWRVGWDPDAGSFQALLGADDWAIELTQPEFDDFCRFAQQLSEAIEQMLSFILLTGRRGEGSWSAEATKEVLRVIQMVQVF